ncbi:MAG: pitrilysin family protein [Pseudomonadota bacterium]
MKKLPLSLLLAACFTSAAMLPAVAATSKKAASGPVLKLDFQKFTLPNGLDVVFHIDRSDPVVAVNLTAHVGSSREKAGRTGFAHLFEHLLFLESENLGKGGLDKMSARIGGSGANGSTSEDRTNYLQTVPKDALEKMIWAEADKLGWFINTVTEPVLAKEKQVVKNEKRQSSDNAPYGHTNYVITKAMYPADHPYNWEVIGSLQDLQNATLDDVKEFFRAWYVPNNVTLVLAGDFDPVQARKWVEKYFSEIKRGAPIQPLQKRPGVVKQTVKLAHEDNFAKLPELNMVWPTVEELHPDGYALRVLAEYLSETKRAPFYKVLVEDEKLTSQVGAALYGGEVAGQMVVTVRAFEGKRLDDVASGIAKAFASFERDGIADTDLKRIKAGLETRFYNSVSNVLGKSAMLAEYNYLTGDPGYLQENLKKTLAVTAADVRRVYDTYIKGKPYVATSFVPKGQLALALSGSRKAEVIEEKVVQGAEDAVDASAQASYTRSPSSFDRSKEPGYGPAPTVKVPQVWDTTLSNGMRVHGIQNSEVPLVQFDIAIDGGQLLDKIDKVGVSNLLARLMTQGTAKRTPQELEEAILQLGASIVVVPQAEEVRIRVTTLARNYRATLDLVREILLEPRWDAKELALIKQAVLSQIRQQEADPYALAADSFKTLVYGKDSIRSRNILGTAASVNAITMDDLKAYYSANLSPSVARMQLIGPLPKAEVARSLNALQRDWKARQVALPAASAALAPLPAKVYFVDVPEAKQSVLQVGYGALAVTNPDYYPAQVMNYILGGGSFASRLTQELREGKGYTYGINSSFTGSKSAGPFVIASAVRSNVTLESTQLVKQILQDYGRTYSAADLATTKDYLVKSNARAFETSAAKLGMLDNISKYGWRANYVKEREQIVQSMTVPQIQALSQKYLDPSKMVWVVVGDAKTQLPRMKELGFGEPVVIGK